MWVQCSARAAAMGAVVLAVAAGSAQAAIVDAEGDFLSVYTGPQNADLDVTRVDARITGPGEVRLTGTHAGAIGTTTGAVYVWGIDRGAGDDILADLNPPAGAGVTFDAVAVVDPAGASFVLSPLDGAPAFLDPSAVSIAGNSISVTLNEALLASTGFAFADYRYNLWPRYAPGGVNPFDNTQISDFAPDASTFTAVIPLPAALALQLAGLAAFGALGWRRRSAQLPPD
jgi:hypothetical protein